MQAYLIFFKLKCEKTAGPFDYRFLDFTNLLKHFPAYEIVDTNCYCIKSYRSAESITNFLSKKVEYDDKIFVVELTENTSAFNSRFNIGDWIKPKVHKD